MTKERFNINSNVALEASAGSGKTYSLVVRYLKILYENFINNKTSNIKLKTKINKILAITFTRKATKEMKDRILNNLEELIKNNKNDFSQSLKNEIDKDANWDDFIDIFKAIYEEIIENLSNINIRTIDSLISEILFSFPLESGLGVNLKIIDDKENEEIINNTIQNFMVNEYNKNEKIKNLVDNFFFKNIKFDLKDFFYNCLQERWHFEDYFENIVLDEEYLDNLLKELNDIYKLENDIENYTKKYFDEILKILQNNYQKSNGSQILYKYFKEKNADLLKIDNLIEPFLKESSKFTKSDLNNSGFIKKDLIYKYFNQNDLADLNEKKFVEIKKFIIKYLKQKNEKLTNIYLFLGFKLLKYYDKIKYFEKNLTFSDITYYAYKLLNKSYNNLNSEDLRDYFYFILNQRFDHILIDEFQDTSLIQWEILSPIVEEIIMDTENRKIFYVGDKKQSIYSWRGGEPKLFDSIFDKYKENFKKDYLDINFRSSKAIVDFTNLIFKDNKLETEKNGISVTAEYQDFVEMISNSENEGYVEFNLSAIPPKNKSAKENSSEENNEENEIETSVYEKIVDKIENLIKNEGIPANNIAILINKNKEIEEYKPLLEAKKINYIIGSNLNLLKSEAVLTLYNLLRYLYNKNDNLRLLEILRSKLFSIDDDAINKYQEIKEEKIDKFIDESYYTLNFIEKINYLLTIFPFFDTYNNRREKNNLLKFVQIASDFYEENGDNLYKFLVFIEKNKDSDLLLQDPDIENSDSIYIITLHKSKGLEFDTVFYLIDDSFLSKNNNEIIKWFLDNEKYFPIIIKNINDILLVYSSCSLIKNEEFINEYNYFKKIAEFYQEYLQKEIQEYLNCLYVAITRARNNLFLFFEEKLNKINIDNKLLCFFANKWEKFNDEINTMNLSDSNSLTITIPFTEFENLIHSIKEIKNFEAIQANIIKDNFKLFNKKIVYENTNLNIIENEIIGDIVHNFMENIEFISDISYEENIKFIKNKWLIKVGQNLFNKAEEKCKKIYDYISDENSELNYFFIKKKNRIIKNEVEFIDNEDFSLKIIDRLIIDDDKIYILDYKNIINEEFDNIRSDIYKKYENQVKNYQNIINYHFNLENNKEIIGYLVFICKNSINICKV